MNKQRTFLADPAYPQFVYKGPNGPQSTIDFDPSQSGMTKFEEIAKYAMTAILQNSEEMRRLDQVWKSIKSKEAAVADESVRYAAALIKKIDEYMNPEK